MFYPNNPRIILVLALVAVGLLVGCAKPPEPCTVDCAQVKAAQDNVAKMKGDLDSAKADVAELERELKAKRAEVRRLEEQKAELEALKSKVEGDRPPRR